MCLQSSPELAIISTARSLGQRPGDSIAPQEFATFRHDKKVATEAAGFDFMAFCFKRKESVCKEVRRLGRERIEKSLECLKECTDAEAIHGVRKDMKKLRALLKLVKSELPKKAYRRQVKLLRKAAQHLSATRDAYVKATALKERTE